MGPKLSPKSLVERWTGQSPKTETRWQAAVSSYAASSSSPAPPLGGDASALEAWIRGSPSPSPSPAPSPEKSTSQAPAPAPAQQQQQQQQQSSLGSLRVVAAGEEEASIYRSTAMESGHLGSASPTGSDKTPVLQLGKGRPVRSEPCADSESNGQLQVLQEENSRLRAQVARQQQQIEEMARTAILHTAPSEHLSQPQARDASGSPSRVVWATPSPDSAATPARASRDKNLDHLCSSSNNNSSNHKNNSGSNSNININGSSKINSSQQGDGQISKGAPRDLPTEPLAVQQTRISTKHPELTQISPAAAALISPRGPPVIARVDLNSGSTSARISPAPVASVAPSALEAHHGAYGHPGMGRPVPRNATVYLQGQEVRRPQSTTPPRRVSILHGLPQTRHQACRATSVAGSSTTTAAPSVIQSVCWGQQQPGRLTVVPVSAQSAFHQPYCRRCSHLPSATAVTAPAAAAPLHALHATIGGPAGGGSWPYPFAACQLTVQPGVAAAALGASSAFANGQQQQGSQVKQKQPAGANPASQSFPGARPYVHLGPRWPQCAGGSCAGRSDAGNGTDSDDDNVAHL